MGLTHGKSAAGLYPDQADELREGRASGGCLARIHRSQGVLQPDHQGMRLCRRGEAFDQSEQVAELSCRTLDDHIEIAVGGIACQIVSCAEDSGDTNGEDATGRRRAGDGG